MHSTFLHISHDSAGGALWLTVLLIVLLGGVLALHVVRQTVRLPSPARRPDNVRPESRSEIAPLLFLGTVLLQSVHFVEHVIQVLQHFALGDPTGAGLAGSRFDIEPVHLGYNGAFLILLVLTCWALGLHRGAARARLPVVAALLAFTLFAQSYHFFEHSVKIGQFIATGTNGTPGVLGGTFNLVWLHFWLNTVVTIPLVLAFFVGRFYRGLTFSMQGAAVVGGTIASVGLVVLLLATVGQGST